MSYNFAHGNADAERGFSTNLGVVNDTRNATGLRSINGLRKIKDTIRYHGGVLNVPITKERINSVREAHSNYKSDLAMESILEAEKRANIAGQSSSAPSQTYTSKDKLAQEKVIS